MRIAMLVALMGLAPAAAGQVFEEVTERLGVAFTHEPGDATFSMSGGCAWFDMDADGDDDLVAVSGDGAHKLFRNDPGGFTDVTAGSGLDAGVPDDVFGVKAADYDDDGAPDLYLTANGPNALLRNDGSGVFTDVTDAVGIGGSAMSTSAAWADFDRDGDLDLYVGNYIFEIDFPYHVGAANRLWVNEGTPAAPDFVDRAAELGVDTTGVFGPPDPEWLPGKEGQPTAGCTLSVNVGDVDDDGDADILVGNDFGMFVIPNQLYRNETPPGGPLAFTDAGETTGFSAFPQFNMGVNLADYDHDGDWDAYLSDLGPNALLRNDDGVFTDVVEEAGPVEGSTGELLLTSWATCWMDADNDSWEDLYVANGFIVADPSIANDPQSPNSLWRNRGDGTFELVPPEVSQLGQLGKGRGAAATDVDGDGAIEIYLVNNGFDDGGGPVGSGAKAHLYRTRPDPDHHWAQFRLAGTASNSEALGARVDAFVGGRLLRRQVHDSGVFLTSPSRIVHFGLGNADVIDELLVRWPSGRCQSLLDLSVDVRRELVEPDVLLADDAAPGTDAGTRRITATIENMASATRRVEVRGELLDGGGALVAADAVSTSVAGRAVLDVTLSAPVGAGDDAPPARWRVRVTDRDSGAVDMIAIPLE